MSERLIFIRNEEEVLGSPLVSYSCSSNTKRPCLKIDVSAYPQSAVDHLNEHLKENPGHTATIKACDIDNS